MSFLTVDMSFPELDAIMEERLRGSKSGPGVSHVERITVRASVLSSEACGIRLMRAFWFSPVTHHAMYLRTLEFLLRPMVLDESSTRTIRA